MIIPDEDRRSFGIVAAALCVLLAVGFASLVAWAGHVVVVDYFKQEEITFWVALSIAILIWFIEEMLHLTLPCRRVFRRLAHRLAELWFEHRAAVAGSPDDTATPKRRRIHSSD